MAQSYTVKDGDTFYKIAEKFYRDGNLWEKIAKANPAINPNELQPGQQINVPD